MTNGEIFMTYALPVIAAALTALAGFIGTQLKGLYQKYINDKTKEAVVRTCVKAAEQLYHDLSGPEKLEKAQEGVVQMLNEKGIPISELEMNLLIEAVVSEFNYGFARASEVSKSDTPALEGDATTPPAPMGATSPCTGEAYSLEEQAPSSGPAGHLPPEGEGSYSEEEGASL